MDSILNEIVNVLETEVREPRGIKAIYYGDPGLIAESNLPALTVSPVSWTTTILSTTSDKVWVTVSVGYVHDMRQVWERNPEQVTIVDEMVRLFCERDANKNYEPDSILGAMLKYLTLNSEVLFCNEYTVDFGVSNRRKFPTIEGLLTFRAQLRPVRPT